MIPFLHLTLPQLIETVGYIGIFFIIFFETGFPFGFIFPGDSLLFTAGFLASTGVVSIPLVCLSIGLGALLGCAVGYFIGYRTGPLLFKKEDSFFFSTRYVRQTERFFEKYGMRAVVFARFVPGVRTFVPLFAGIGRMRLAPFMAYNAIGALAWCLTIPLAGFWLGRAFPQSEHYLTYIIIAILVISVLPVAYEFYTARRKH